MAEGRLLSYRAATMGLAPLDPRPFDALPVDENNPKEKSITELEYETWRTPGIQKAVQHGPCSRCYHLLPICRITC